MATKKPDDSYATNQTYQYIQKLEKQLEHAKDKKTSAASALEGSKEQLSNTKEKHTAAKQLLGEFKKNQEEAEAALGQVSLISAFFTKQVTETRKMSGLARETAIDMVKAVSYLISHGTDRIDSIKTITTADNKKHDKGETWTEPFMTHVSEADAKGTAALKSGKTAVDTALTAYASNEGTHVRTKAYLKECHHFEDRMGDLVTRINRETTLAQSRYTDLDIQLSADENLVSKYQGAYEEARAAFDRITQEHTAATKGAAYTYVGK